MSDQHPSSDEPRPKEKQSGERRGSANAGGRSNREGRRPSAPPPNQSRRSDASLNMEELRELMELFTAHGLTDFEIENEEIRVRLSRNLASAGSVSSSPTFAAPPASSAAPSSISAGSESTSPTSSGGASTAAGAATTPDEDLHIITSPIVGTFYRASSPTAESFVRPGSHVEPDTIVCIIEAMKLMNEIQAETTGIIEKIYVENGQPVEYGQPLFGIKR